MTIRKRFLLYLVAHLLFLIVVVTVSGQWLTERTFADFERLDAVSEMERILRQTEDAQRNLLSTVEDWAIWDESYAFVQGKNPSFPKDNLQPGSLRHLRIHSMLFFGLNGAFVSSAYADPSEQPLLSNAALTRDVASAIERKRDGSSTGFLRSGGQVFYYAAHPLLHSDESGPPLGAVVMLRRLDEAELTRLSGRHAVTLRFRDQPQGQVVNATLGDVQLSEQNPDIRTWHPDSDTISASAPLRDAAGAPLGQLVMEKPRDFFKLGRDTLLTAFGMILLFGLVSGLLLIWILEVKIIRRLVRLSEGVREIGKEQTEALAASLRVGGEDEVTELASAIQNLVALERVRTEELRESEERFRGLLDTWPDPVIIYDHEGKALYVNDAFEWLYGWSRDEVLGTGLKDFVPEEEKEISDRTWVQVLETGVAKTLETRRFTKTGAVLSVKLKIGILRDASGKHVASLVLHRDVTAEREAERRNRKLQERAQHSQRLESLGVLAGGIAHDFNNVLTPIIGFAELALDDVTPDSEIAHNLKRILISAERAKDLVSQILVFSREGMDEIRPLHFVLVVKECLQLLRASMPATITINTEYRFQRDLVNGNPAQIHQLLLNLAANAAHALNDAGTLSVSVAPAARADWEKAGLPKGDYLLLSVADDGAGIPEEIQGQIFDPFFTTKAVGQGSGLGLSVVHGIVQKMGGAITFSTKAGEGTRFDICLPLCGSETQETAGANRHAQTQGKGKILLADDEAFIVELWAKALTRMGFDVEAFGDAAQALEAFRKDPEGYRLIVTDQTMPQLSGDEFIREAREVRPGVPIILCTGYSKNLSAEQVRALDVQAFLSKPVTLEQLAAAIVAALGGDG